MNYFKAEDDLIIRTITQTDRQTDRQTEIERYVKSQMLRKKSMKCNKKRNCPTNVKQDYNHLDSCIFYKIKNVLKRLSPPLSVDVIFLFPLYFLTEIFTSMSVFVYVSLYWHPCL